jgi:hypothetical protein
MFIAKICDSTSSSLLGVLTYLIWLAHEATLPYPKLHLNLLHELWRSIGLRLEFLVVGGFTPLFQVH